MRRDSINNTGLGDASDTIIQLHQLHQLHQLPIRLAAGQILSAKRCRVLRQQANYILAMGNRVAAESFLESFACPTWCKRSRKDYGFYLIKKRSTHWVLPS